MASKYDIFLGVLDNIALIGLANFGFVVLARRFLFRNQIRFLPALLGFFFGLMSILSMLKPIHVADGVNIDSRTIMVALAGAMAGMPAALVAALMAACYRYLLGGVGWLPGVLAIMSCAVIGSLFHRGFVSPNFNFRLRWLVLLGLFCALAGLLWGLILPVEIRWQVFQAYGAPVLFLYPLGATFLGATLFNESRVLRLQQAQDGLVADVLAHERKVVRAHKMKTEFMAIMSHEIRTQLNAVLGSSQLLKYTELNEQQSSLVDIIETGGQTLLLLLNDLLDLEKIEAGKLELKEEPIILSDLVKSAVDLIRSQAEAKALKVWYTVDPMLPAKINADPARLRQVLLNLLSNAVKFTNAGSIGVEVQLLPAHEHDKSQPLILFSVVDTGVGIAASDLERLFKPFSQINGPMHSQNAQGTGLGLVICKLLVEAMGGSIQVKSQVGQGTRFEFSIGLKDFTHYTTELKNMTSNDLPKPTRPAFRHLKVLVAEDNMVNQKITEYQFQQFQVQPIIVADGLEALKELNKTAYDAAFLDIQMPHMDGSKVAQEVLCRKYPKRPYLVALTAYAMADERREIMEYGFDDFLSKPVSISELERVLRDVLAVR